jgi:nucleoside recognition membrane protein YjiH
MEGGRQSRRLADSVLIFLDITGPTNGTEGGGTRVNEKSDGKISIVGLLALLGGVILFSGLLTKAPGFWKAFDFTNLTGTFGKILPEAAAGFRGSGGTGARDGFVFALTLVPGVMLALGLVNVIDYLGGLKAAQQLITPILRPIVGIPGVCALTMIAALQSSDAAAAMSRQLRDDGFINQKELNIFATWQFVGGPPISNYYTIASALFPFLTVPIIIPLVIWLLGKFVVANISRFTLNR